MKYRKKPVEIEAVQWTGNNFNEICSFVSNSFPLNVEGNVLKITTLEGIMEAIPTDFIIRGVKGEFYPCKLDIFEKTYDKVDENSS